MPDQLSDQTRTAYDRVAVSYAAALPDATFEAPLDLAMMRQFATQLGEDGPAQLLDAGCGTGRMIPLLLSYDPSLVIWGMDLSPVMIELARASHPDIPFDEGTLSALPYRAEQFDGVIAWYSIIHTPPHQLPVILAEFRRVLRSGGKLLLAYQVGIGERVLTRPYGHDLELRAFLHRTDSIEEALAEAGFEMLTRLDRSPRKTERHAQGFVIARRVEKDRLQVRAA